MSPINKLKGLPVDIGQSVRQTFGLYIEAQATRRDEIVRGRSEAQYGPTPRHKLDVFDVLEDIRKDTHPVVIFVYGGGLTKGDKRMGPGDVYSNVGRFFADQGFITIIPDYRLVGVHDGTIFPSGGEDISLVLQWLAAPGNVPKADLSSVFLVGNSAGGVHVSTFLFLYDPPYTSLEQLSPTLSVKGAALVSVPFSFDKADPSRYETQEMYFGSKLGDGKTPLELRRASANRTPLVEIHAEREPEEILEPISKFMGLYAQGALEGHDKPDQLFIPKHNHISPPLALGLGGDEDKWGYDLVNWIKSKL
ncbi:hypothetical protein MNV49_001797 [Pseudohyphozyma bogoriensis]|nr:hypothetical protein MNV49_001797 [Pseudohyphozyma bogoriensis]